MLLEHLIVRRAFGANSLVCWSNFIHIPDHIHTRTELIHHQITQSYQFIIFDELFNFLNTLFKFLNFFAHLLTLSYSWIYGNKIAELLSYVLKFLVIAAFKLRDALLYLLELLQAFLILVLIERLNYVLGGVLQIVYGGLTVHLQLEIDIV